VAPNVPSLLLPMRPAPKHRTQIMVIWPYEAQEHNEINLIEGEYIYDVGQLDYGWWRSTTANGEEGVPCKLCRGSAAPEVPPFLFPARAAPNPVTSGMQESLQGQKKWEREEREREILIVVAKRRIVSVVHKCRIGASRSGDSARLLCS
jgi:hypothetical protein